MESKAQQLLNLFQQYGGILRFSAILQGGFHPDTLTDVQNEGLVEQLGRGLYRLTDSDLGPHPDLLTACLQAPKGVICLLSALAFHEATHEIPHTVDIAIPRGSRANTIKYPPVRFYRFALETWEAGIQEHPMAGQTIKVYDLAKTVADCFKFRSAVGLDVAREALKISVMEKRVPAKDIMRYAKLCRVSSIIKPILESFI